MKIYIAGSSKEYILVASYIQKVEAMGHRVTQDWTEAIRAHGAANDASVPRQSQKYHAELDLVGIEDAHLIWFICPELDSKGMWVELGYALAIKRMLSRFKMVTLIASGNTKQCIFLAGIDLLHHYETHDLALESIKSTYKGF